MSESATAEQPNQTIAEDIEIQSEIRALFARMDEMDVQIERNQAETDRLKVETRAMLATLASTVGG